MPRIRGRFSPAIDRSLSAALLERFSADQRCSFLQTWNRLPSHMCEIAFDLHGPGWTPAVITQLGDVLAEVPDVFSKSSTDFVACSLLPFNISVPPNSSPVAFRPYRINPPTAKQVYSLCLISLTVTCRFGILAYCGLCDS